MEKLITLDPYTGQPTGEFSYDSLETVTEKVNLLAESQAAWTKLLVHERRQYIEKALDYFESNVDLIAQDICEQMGRPVHQAKGEIKGLLERGHHMCAIAEDSLRPEVLSDKPGFDRSIEHSPYGVIFVIAAWNFPLLIAINSVVPALLAGNTVLLKHSNLTPKLGAHFVNAFGNLGEHKNLVLQAVTSHEATGQVIEKTKVNHVIFTGSVEGGRSILKHTNKRFITPLLELGGKDAAFVDEDANISSAAATIVDGAMFNSGQSCCGIERVYCHEKVFDDFIKAALKELEQYNLGDPKSSETNLGPVAKKSAVEHMQSQIDEAVKLGAKVLFGGKKETIGSGHFFQPTLLVDVDHKMQVMKEENFGPIMPVMKVKGFDEALSLVNDCDYGLTSAIFTQNKKSAEKFADHAQVGTVFMNRCDYLDPALPWTGYKNSGCGGSSLSKFGFFHVTHRKSRHFKAADV